MSPADICPEARASARPAVHNRKPTRRRGAIAAKATLAQPADGYTLFFCGSGMAVSMSLFKTKPFDIVRDFTLISTISKLDELLLATGANSQFNSISEVIDTGKRVPDKITLGSINPGSLRTSRPTCSRLTTDIEATIVPYRSTPDLISALIRATSMSAWTITRLPAS